MDDELIDVKNKEKQKTKNARTNFIEIVLKYIINLNINTIYNY